MGTSAIIKIVGVFAVGAVLLIAGINYTVYLWIVLNVPDDPLGKQCGLSPAQQIGK
jgi:hypothetical protein